MRKITTKLQPLAGEALFDITALKLRLNVSCYALVGPQHFQCFFLDFQYSRQICCLNINVLAVNQTRIDLLFNK
jgi:hypothetical protein